MADKHPPLLRTQVEIAAACGVPVRQIQKALGISRTTQDRWLKRNGAARQEQYRKKWVQKNPEAKARWHKKWCDNNPEAKRLSNKNGYRKHYDANPEYYAEKAFRRRRGLQQWPCSKIEKLMIKYRYEDARRLTRETGVLHHVDHIWPIVKGGPHLPWNLQVLTAQENLSKADSV